MVAPLSFSPAPAATPAAAPEPDLLVLVLIPQRGDAISVVRPVLVVLVLGVDVVARFQRICLVAAEGVGAGLDAADGGRAADEQRFGLLLYHPDQRVELAHALLRLRGGRFELRG